MNEKLAKMSVFEQIKTGLEEGIAYWQGRLDLKTTVLPSPPPKARGKDIAGLRASLGMSQALFAATLNVSPRTVQSWEQGIRQPADAALRMIQVIRESPQVVRLILGPVRVRPGRRSLEKNLRSNKPRRLAV